MVWLISLFTAAAELSRDDREGDVVATLGPVLSERLWVPVRWIGCIGSLVFAARAFAQGSPDEDEVTGSVAGFAIGGDDADLLCKGVGP